MQSQDESDVEAPAFTGDPFAGTAESTRDVRLTLRDVILVRSERRHHAWPARAAASTRPGSTSQLGGIPYSYIRGFAWADLKIGRTRLRFVTTHLESERADLTLAQADELLAGAAADRPGPR